MILTTLLTAARGQRTPIAYPEGTWVSRLFPASAETPARPMALFVEKQAHTTIPPHFHEVNQFQVVVEGHGTLGKYPVQPWTIHYTNGFTGYGPIRAGEAGLGFLTLRNRFDGGAHYFPAGQSFMKPAPKRHHLAGPAVLSPPVHLQNRQSITCDTVLAPEDDGLAVWCLRLGPGMHTPAPDPAPGGGQYVLVANGTLLHHGTTLPTVSCVYVSADSEPFVLHSGAQGLEVLVLQFPVAEAYATDKTIRRSGRASSGAASAPRRSVSQRLPAPAHPEHVALVQQGAAALAAWRQAHPDERLVLTRADLRGADLRGANLQGARLQEANLDAADLCGANLQHADLRAASLIEANLTGARLQLSSVVRANLHQACLAWARLQRAHLHGAYLHQACLHQANLQKAHLVSTDLVAADLRGAFLEQADLHWANLQEANLQDVRLHEANLHEMVIGHTTFAHTDLRGAQGLETCRHQAPSTLDLATLACSGQLPDEFLRGCGWPDNLMTSLRGLLQAEPGLACIERAFAFPPEALQIGLQLLSSLGTVLPEQHPDITIQWRLEQVGMMTRIVITTPPERRHSVEQTLQAYGRTLAEQAPQHLLLSPPGAESLLPGVEQLRQVCQGVGQVLQDL